ncbi:MAG: Dabb family protein [Acidimicrobiia bacterium]|nr:Dabb family protein [Acidimicrobiia bacterium]
MKGLPVIEHFVLFKALAGKQEAVSAACAEFERAIAGEPYIEEMTWGPNINARSMALGWTHGMLARITTYEAFQTEYWHHEAHVEFVGQLDSLCEIRFAIDYTTNPREPS